MTALENIKNGLIDRILATKNEKLLLAIKTIFETAGTEDIISVSSEQLEMLMMSENDVVNNRLVSEDDLNNSDSEWLH